MIRGSTPRGTCIWPLHRRSASSPFPTATRFIETGRLWQRVQLEATLLGLGMQPLEQAIEALERARQLGVAPTDPTPGTLAPSADDQVALMFRVGYPVRAALPSPRRPLSAVLI